MSTVTERLTLIESKIRQNITDTQNGELVQPPAYELFDDDQITEEQKDNKKLRNSTVQAHQTDDVGIKDIL